MGTPDPDQVLDQVERICQNRAFAQSTRLTDFLRFTVNATLAGKASSLKEYLIGVEVYRRPSGYDPKADSIVRSEAVRLRAKLQDYYRSDGNQDGVRIQYLKGTYAPVIQVRHGGPRAHTIAVLPFANAGSSSQDEFFSDGLTDELIAALAKVPDLRVIARTSAFQFKDKAVDVRRAGKRLNATAVLEGSVRHWRGRLRISAQLIDVETGCHLWSDTYDRRWGDLLAIQGEISQAVARNLGREFAVSSAPLGAADSEVHRLYLKGRYCFHKWTVDHVQKSLSWFEQAIGRDPNYAKAWAGIGDSHNILAYWGVATASNALRAEVALLKALALDPKLLEAEANYAAHLAIHQWQWEESARRFRRLTSHGDSHACHLYAVTCLTPQGRLDEASRYLRRALDLDPLFLGAQCDLGRIFYLAGRPREAIEQQLRVLELDANFREAHWQLALAYESAQAFDQAMASFGRALALSGDSPGAWGSLGHCYAKWGKIAEARRYERMLRQASAEKSVLLPALALIHVGLGEMNRALQCLEDSLISRSPACLRLKTDPRYAPLRFDCRFIEMLQRIGFPPESAG